MGISVNSINIHVMQYKKVIKVNKVNSFILLQYIVPYYYGLFLECVL